MKAKSIARKVCTC